MEVSELFKSCRMHLRIYGAVYLLYIGQTVVLRPENFALICGLCLEQLSDNTRMQPLGTCQNEGHFKVCTVMHV